MIRKYNMKKLLAMFLATIISLMPLSFAASADAPAPVVELALAEDGTVTDIAGSGATEISWSNSAVPKAAYGSFKNKSGDMTSYLQFGTDPDGDGIYAVGNSNWLEIQNSAMNGLPASTMSFWMRLEEAASIYRPYALYAKKSTDGAYVRGAAAAGQSGWLIADYSANATAYELKAASMTEAKNSMWGATDSWTNNWVHMVITRTYDADAKVSTVAWYINGGLNPTVTTKVNGELSDESNHVYAIGSSRVAQYSGIKLYNTEMAANVIYAAEKDLYEEFEETEMLLLSPTEDGSLTKTSGKLDLSFNCAVEESTLSGVTLKKAGSDENMLGAYTLSGGKKMVSFPYSGLEVGSQYILSVSGVVSDKGLTMTAPVTLTYTVLQDPSLKVDAEIHADGSVTNKIEEQNATFTYTASKPSGGNFMNETGNTTSYLQFGGDETYLEVYDADMNGQPATTVSFWIRIENTGAQYRPIVLYGTDADNYTNAAAGNEYLIPDYNPLMFVLRGSAFSDAYQGGTNWGNVWSHMVLTRVYDAVTNKWTVSWYRNGSKLQSRTVSGALPDESNYVYVFGGKRAAKYSGIKLYSDEMSASTLYNNEKALYEALPESMEIASVEPASGLSQSGGEITITFNNYVDESTISDITLKNSDETPINGKYLVYMPEKRSKVVKLRYGELENEEYLLQIPASVASINGYTLGQPEIIDLACISNVIFREDFEELEEGTVAHIDGLTPYSSSVQNSWEDFTILTDAVTGRKYMTFIAQAAGEEEPQATETGIFYTLPDSVDNSEVVFELKFKAIGEGEAEREILRPYTGVNGSGESSTMLKANDEGAAFVGQNDYAEDTAFTSVADEEGWHTVKMVTGLDDSETRYFDFYYDAMNPMDFCRVVRNSFNPDEIRSVLLAEICAEVTGSGTAAVAIDEIKVYKRTTPTVIGGSALTAESATDTIYFGSAMNLASLQNAEYYYVNEQEEKVMASFDSYDETERAVTIRVKDYFSYGETYSLYIKGAKSADGVSLTEEAVYSYNIAPYCIEATTPVFQNTATGAKVTDLSQAASVSVVLTLNSTKADDTTVSVILLHRDNAGRLKHVKQELVSVSSGGGAPVNTAVSEKAFVAGDSVSLLIWDEPLLGAKPVLFNPVTISCGSAQ